MKKNPNQQVKRYTDIENQKYVKSCIRVSIILGSIVLGAVGIFLGVYFSKSRPKPPTDQTVSDDQYQTYLKQNKFLPAWSHTNESKLNGQPAYL